jgi:hypothetical protein
MNSQYPFSSSKLARIEKILEDEPAVARYLGPKTTPVRGKEGDRLFSKVVVDFALSLHQAGKDIANVSRMDVLRAASQAVRALSEGKSLAVAPPPVAPAPAPEPPPAVEMTVQAPAAPPPAPVEAQEKRPASKPKAPKKTSEVKPKPTSEVVYKQTATSSSASNITVKELVLPCSHVGLGIYSLLVSALQLAQSFESGPHADRHKAALDALCCDYAEVYKIRDHQKAVDDELEA